MKVRLSLKEHIQRSREAVAANKAKGNKHAELFATMYTQPSRFIEEILQNTEDAYSRKNADDHINAIRFKIYPDKIEVHHNGKDFDENDLMSITTFANTTKKNNTEVNLIGKFGIGFKSVFSITDFPEIHCGSYHYKITDYEVLTPCETKQADEGFRTLIILPFKRKETAECYNAVKQGLDELNSFHLLFLKKLNRIEVYDQNRLLSNIKLNAFRMRRHIEKRIIRKRSFIDGTVDTVETYLIHTSKGSNQKKLPELAFKIQQSDGKLIFEPIADAPLFVYFPLKMYPGLSFLIHAPFTTNPLRDYALFDAENCPENMQMLNESVHSFVLALLEFKKIGFYTIDLLAKLFIKQPEKDARDRQKYIIQESFFNAFSEYLIFGDNLPLGNNKFAKIQKVLIPADESVYHLLNGPDLEKLFQKSAFIDYAICSERMTDFRNFLANDLHVKTIDAESFGFRLKVTSGFLEGKPITWLKSFYKYLHSHQKLWDIQHADLFYSLRRSPVILTDKNHFESAFNNEDLAIVFKPGMKKELLPVVHPKLLEDDPCVSFFDDLGIKQADLISDVFLNIVPQFRQGSIAKQKDYLKKLEKIITASSEASQTDRAKLIDLLKNTSWLKCHDEAGKIMFSMPGKVYLKNDYLVQYFKSCPEICFLDALIQTRCIKRYPETAKTFFKDIGLIDVPRIIYSDKQIIIEGFDNFLTNINVSSSKTFAKLLLKANENYYHEGVLQFLRKQKWVYTKKGYRAAPESMNISDISVRYSFREVEKIRFLLLMGIADRIKPADMPQISWHPQLIPEEIDIELFANQNAAPTHIEGDINLLSSMQAAINVFEPKDVELKEFSESELEDIDHWSKRFLLRILQQEFSGPEFGVESSQMADFVVYKNGIIFRYIFATGKTDLMHHYFFTAKKFINIFKLIDSRADTFLYCINSVGSAAVSLRQFNDPFEMITNEKIRFNGKLFLITD